MLDLFFLGLYLLVPLMLGAALAFWRYGWIVVGLLVALALAVAVFVLLEAPGEGESLGEAIGRAVFPTLMYLVAGELSGGWAVASLLRFWRRKRDSADIKR